MQSEGGRAAIDFLLVIPFNREIDDVGFFESIMLARPYRLMLDLAGDPPTRNVQSFDGSRLNAGALRSLGVKLVVTSAPRRDLNEIARAARDLPVYAVPNTAPRAAFFPDSAVRYAPPDAIHADLRRAAAVPRSTLTLSRSGISPTGPAAPAELAPPTTGPASGPSALSVGYRRVDSDEIVLTAAPPAAGWVRVLESWDPGWRATVDGAPAEIALAEDAFMAVPLPAGPHEVRLRYATPGVAVGIALSAVSIVLLVLLTVWAGRAGRNRSAGSDVRRQ
jgi:hypothetical protein